MGGEFWEFLSLLLQSYGLVSVLSFLEAGLVVYLFWLLHKKETEKTTLQSSLLKLSEQRLADAKEERQDYEELARSLEKSINLLVAAFRRRNGDNGE